MESKPNLVSRCEEKEVVDMDGFRPGEAARMYWVTPHTLIRWERMGLLEAVRTVGGRMRWRGEQVEALLKGGEIPNQQATDRLD